MKGYFNDLWRYSESEGWIWIDGSDQLNIPSNYSEIDPYPGGRDGSAIWIDENDNLWIFGGYAGFIFYFNNFRCLLQ